MGYPRSHITGLWSSLCSNNMAGKEILVIANGGNAEGAAEWVAQAGTMPPTETRHSDYRSQGENHGRPNGTLTSTRKAYRAGLRANPRWRRPVQTTPQIR